jgi:hypothetical protein
MDRYFYSVMVGTRFYDVLAGCGVSGWELNVDAIMAHKDRRRYVQVFDGDIFIAILTPLGLNSTFGGTDQIEDVIAQPDAKACHLRRECCSLSVLRCGLSTI